MDQQQVELIYSQWEAAKNANDVAGMVALCHDLRDSSTWPKVANCTGMDLLTRARDPGQARRAYRYLLGAREAADFGSITWIMATGNSTGAANILGLHREAIDYANSLVALSEEVLAVRPRSLYLARLHLAYAHYCEGDFLLGAASADKASTMREVGSIDARNARLYWCANMARAGHVQESLSEATKLEVDSPNSGWAPSASGVIAYCFLAQGKYEECISSALRVADGPTPSLCGGQEWRIRAEIEDILATAYAALGDQLRSAHHARNVLTWNGGRPIRFGKRGVRCGQACDGGFRVDRGGHLGGGAGI